MLSLFSTILFAQDTINVSEALKHSHQEQTVYYLKGEKFTGIIIKNYPNKQLEYEVMVEDGLENGISKHYYENGNLESRINFIEGEKEGLFESYYKNGVLKGKSTMLEGQFKGVATGYYENGNLKIIGNYKDNLNYSAKIHYESGSLWSEVTMINGKLNGVYLEYYENDIKEGTKGDNNKNPQLKIRANYINNKRDGVYLEYYENGNLSRKRMFKNDIESIKTNDVRDYNEEAE